MDDKPLREMSKRELLKFMESLESRIQNANAEMQTLKGKTDSAGELQTQAQEWWNQSKELFEQIQECSNTTNNLSDAVQQQRNKANTLTEELQKCRDSAEAKRQEMDVLTRKIESLLPGATSAGLASSYHDAQEGKGTWPYWLGFIFSIGTLFVGYSYYFIFQSQIIDWSNIFARTTIGFPLIWLAWYCQKSIAQTRRIAEEYHHKERIMSIYEGFAKQIDQSDEGEAKRQELVSVLIKAVAINPARNLDPRETFLSAYFGRNKIREQDP